MEIVMREIPAGEFKAKCLKLLDEVAESGEEIVITKRGKPVGRLLPPQPTQKGPFDIAKGSVTILGDIMSPIGVEDWEALK
jgi:prevent-host-death family protein